jgi:N-methylhydantoinase B/acetone carboxylase alpha subunit
MATIGDAEEFESTVPPMFYLGRKLLPGYFGAGKYRGGPGESAVHWCVEPGKHIGITRPNGGLSSTASVALGMNGAYPGPSSFMISARGTNLDEVNEKGLAPRDARELLEMTDSGELKVDDLQVWKMDCPELSMKNNDLFVDAAGSSGGWGDPLDRDPNAVIEDLNSGVCPDYDFVKEMHGVIAEQASNGSWTLDQASTDAKRVDLRKKRLSESSDLKDWWVEERDIVQNAAFFPEVGLMYNESLSFDKFRKEFTSFWNLPLEFNVLEG